MSPVYWGIVTGLVSMVVLLFVCLEILYRGVPQAMGTGGTPAEDSADKKKTGRGAKHAA